MNEDKAERYQRRRARATALTLIVSALALGLLGLTPLGRLLRDVVLAAVGESSGNRWLASGAYGALVGLVLEASTFALRYRRDFALDRHYGLHAVEPWAWVRGHAGASLVSCLLLGVGAAAAYQCAVWWPRAWWVAAGAAWIVIVLGLPAILPTLVMPLVWPTTPLEQPALVKRLRAVAARAGVTRLDVRVWRPGHDQARANAALVGLGPHQRVLLSDGLLTDYSEDEIEVVLAHELGHHVHGDLWKDLASDAVVTLVVLAACAWTIGWSWEALGLSGPTDIAGLPVLLLAGGAVVQAVAPLRHAWSRARERRADEFALTLTRNPAAFSTALRRLGAQHLADARTPVLSHWWLGSHPTVRERLEAADTWAHLDRTTNSPRMRRHPSSIVRLQ